MRHWVVRATVVETIEVETDFVVEAESEEDAVSVVEGLDYSRIEEFTPDTTYDVIEREVLECRRPRPTTYP